MTQIPDPADVPMGAVPAYSPQQAERVAAVDELNTLLRGEISAAETYKMAIDKVSDSDRSRIGDVATLREMQEDHGRAAQALRVRILDLGGTAANSSGAWGAWAKTVEGAASLFGDRAALKALKEGEQHGLKLYEDSADELDMGSAQLVASELIPAQQRHISLLDRMLDTA